MQPKLFLRGRKLLCWNILSFALPQLSYVMGFEVLENPFKSFDLICECFWLWVCVLVRACKSILLIRLALTHKHARAIASNGNCFVIIIIVFRPYVLCAWLPSFRTWFHFWLLVFLVLFVPSIVKMLKTCTVFINGNPIWFFSRNTTLLVPSSLFFAQKIKIDMKSRVCLSEKH